MRVILWIATPLVIIAGIFAMYFFSWVMAYPAIGYYCETANTVKSAKLDGEFWGGKDRYLITYTDDTQSYEGYHKIGEVVCLSSAATLLPWEPKPNPIEENK